MVQVYISEMKYIVMTGFNSSATEVGIFKTALFSVKHLLTFLK